MGSNRRRGRRGLGAGVAAVVVLGCVTATIIHAESRNTTASAASTGAANSGAASTGAASAPGGMPSPADAAAVQTAAAAPSGTSGTPPTTRFTQLTAAPLLADPAEQWRPLGPSSTRDIAGHAITENECPEIVGATTWIQQGYSGGADGRNPAVQDTFAYADPAMAQSAYQTFRSGMARCQSTSRAYQSTHGVAPDAKVTETADLSDAAAWERSWTGVMGMSAAGPQTNHTYLAVHGTRVIVLQFTEFPGQSASYNVSGDPRVLALLTAEADE